jgi:uncharacterized membrane protein YphA (DoxX/SURF4 family)
MPIHGAALRILSIALGIFFLFMGIDKLAWWHEPERLSAELTRWAASAPAPSRWYVRTIALPGAPAFAYLVLVGELGVAAALLTGVYMRAAALVGFFMVVNFHFAMGVMLSMSYLWNGYGPPVLGGLLALSVGGAGLPLTVARRHGSRPVKRRR